ncbi:MAG TPA: VOC family protein [Pelomicrobium sp.]|nr:VOC family protein [Pelomicrobium sp.]
MEASTLSGRVAAAAGLDGAQVTAILAVSDLERARQFYEERLGLVAVGTQPDGKFLFRCGGTDIALFAKPEGARAEHTVLSFRVDDIGRAIAALERRGVTFADYDLPGLKTVNHVCLLGSEKAAWFQDTEGNILCLHEEIEPRPAGAR